MLPLPRLISECLPRHLVIYYDSAPSNHEDIKMKLFALSLENDAAEWYEELGDDSYKTLINS